MNTPDLFIHAFLQPTRFSLDPRVKCTRVVWPSCLHYNGALGLGQDPLFCKPQHNAQSYSTFPFRPIYPHTSGLKQEAHPVSNPVSPVHVTSFHPSHFQLLDAKCTHIFSSSLPYTVHNKLRTKEVYILRSHHKNTNNMKNQAIIFSLKPTSPVKWLPMRIT